MQRSKVKAETLRKTGADIEQRARIYPTTEGDVDNNIAIRQKMRPN